MPIHTNFSVICENCMPKTWNRTTGRIFYAMRFIIALKAKIRDRKKCAICGSKKDITAHHIFAANEFPELQFNLDNHITMCATCHSELNILIYGHSWKLGVKDVCL